MGYFSIPLTVVLADETCQYPGLIGFELYRQELELKTGFSMSGPGGNPRLREDGHRVADTIACVYPRGKYAGWGRYIM